MADKKFGVKQLDLIGTGTPTIQSANNLNLNATTTAISNDVTVGGNLTVTGSITGSVGSIVKLGTVATNTGTEAAFTNIPSTAKKITVAIHNFGYAGTNSELIMEVGDSTGYATSGYQSSYDNRDNGPDGRSRTNAYGLSDDTNNGIEQNITVELVNVTGNSWTISHTGGTSDSNGSVIHGGGSISLTNALDRLRIKTADSNTLDHGHVTVYYETTSDTPAANTVSSDAIVLQTAKSAATGNSNPIEFIDIPADAYEITLMFNGVTLSGGNDYLVQLGTSSSYIETGYTSTSINEGGTTTTNSNDGFIVFSNSTSEKHGKYDINKFSDTAYTFEGQTRRSTAHGTQAYGTLNGVNGTITRLRIKPSVSNNFTGGSFNISYKTPGSANNEGTDAGQGFFTNDTTLNSSKTLPANKNVGIFGPYTIANNVTLTVPTGTTFTVV